MEVSISGMGKRESKTTDFVVKNKNTTKHNQKVSQEVSRKRRNFK